MDWKLIWFPFWLGFLDRWGGGGFEFLGRRVPLPKKGWKAARRVGVPLSVLMWSLSFERSLFAVAMLAILAFNLNELEPEHHVPARRDWEEIFLYAFGLAFCVWTLAGWWSALVVSAWPFGVYWSHKGIGGHRLGHHWLELFFRSFAIGWAVVLAGWFGRGV